MLMQKLHKIDLQKVMTRELKELFAGYKKRTKRLKLLSSLDAACVKLLDQLDLCFRRKKAKRRTRLEWQCIIHIPLVSRSFCFMSRSLDG